MAIDDAQDQMRDVFEAKSTKERSERCQELVSAAFAGMRATRASKSSGVMLLTSTRRGG